MITINMKGNVQQCNIMANSERETCLKLSTLSDSDLSTLPDSDLSTLPDSDLSTLPDSDLSTLPDLAGRI